MPKTRTPHLNRETRKGIARYYFRKGNGPRIRIGHPYGSEAFWAEYQELLDGKRFCSPRENPDGVRGTFPRRIEWMLAGARSRAYCGKRDFDLNRDWLIEEFKRNDYRCAVTRIPFQSDRIEGSRTNPFAPSLDRIDPSRGYTQDNVRIVLTSVNVALSDWGLDHFDQIVTARMQLISGRLQNGTAS